MNKRCFFAPSQKTPKINKRKEKFFMIRNLKKEKRNMTKKVETNKGITLIALVITIVLNCSFLAMV